MKTKDYFVTENGSRIQLTPGWFEVKSDWPYGITDFKRYYREIRPEILTEADKCIYFSSSHLTALDYKEEALKVGLRPLSYRRSFIENPNRFFLNQTNAKYFYSTILPESQRINPHVSVADFFTQYLTMAFVKD